MNQPRTALKTTNVPRRKLEQDGDVLEERRGMGAVSGRHGADGEIRAALPIGTEPRGL